jgi:hypothetical protein
MPGQMLDWVNRRLGEDEDVIVPLKRLWKEWHAMNGEPSLEEFSVIVLSDARFEHLYSVEQDPQMETFGYFSGPRIKLRSREITQQCVLKLIKKYNENVVKTLRRVSELLHEEEDSCNPLGEAILLLEEVRPALTPWVHLEPPPYPFKKVTRLPEGSLE